MMRQLIDRYPLTVVWLLIALYLAVVVGVTMS